MDPPKKPSHKFEEFIKKRTDPIVTILKGDFWIIKKRRWLKWFWLICLGLFFIFGTGFYYYLYHFSGFKFKFLEKPDKPFLWFLYTGGLVDDRGKPIDFGKLGRKEFKKASYAYASDKVTIIERFFDEVRDPIKIEEVPEVVKQAFIAAEDKRFYSHSGVDWRAVGRAQFFNWLHLIAPAYFRRAGGSTITVQVVRQLHAEDLEEFRIRRQNYWRKIKEARIAIRVEKIYSKDQILETFLNLPYFDHGVNGVAEAVHRYFGKNIRQDLIGLRESAILAAMNKSPIYFCPIFHEPPAPQIDEDWPEEKTQETKERHRIKVAKEHNRIFETRDRENYVLEQMLKNGFINQEQYKQAYFSKDEPLQLAVVKLWPLKKGGYSYGGRMTKELLFNIGFDDEEITHYGGLRIRTCIDKEKQEILNNKITRHLAELNSELEDKSNNPIDGSAAIMDVENGCVVAVFGGHDYFNRLLALRSIGSGAKPFVYGAAFEYAGKNFGDPILNRPFRKRGADGKPWIPKNFPEDNPVPQGYIPIEVGQIRSVNLPTLRLAEEIGMDKVVLFTHQLGIWGNYGIVKDPQGNTVFRMPGIRDQGDQIVPLLPTAIGASDVNLLELITAYAAFFREGRYLPPKLVLEVSDSEGKILYKSPDIQLQQQISRETAIKELILMRMTAEVGTAKISMKNKDEEQQYGIKTGTSNNPKPKQGAKQGEGPGDVGMYGGSPKYVMAIRLGHDKPKPIIIPNYMRKISRQNNMRVSGGWVVGFIFREIMDAIHTGGPVIKFPPEVEQGTAELLANYPEKYK